MTRATVSADGETITVHIPITFRKRGGRKLVVTPDGAAWAPRPRVDNAMVKALARAFRWRKMLDEGVYATLEDLARAKGVNATYVSRILRLTILAPEIVEAILDGLQSDAVSLPALMKPFPSAWVLQRRESPARRASQLPKSRAGRVGQQGDRMVCDPEALREGHIDIKRGKDKI